MTSDQIGQLLHENLANVRCRDYLRGHKTKGPLIGIVQKISDICLRPGITMDYQQITRFEESGVVQYGDNRYMANDEGTDRDRRITRLESQMRDYESVASGRLERLVSLERSVSDMARTLFGNGQPGALAQIQSVIQQTQKRLDGHDKWIWIATGVIIAMQFVAGSGFISLKSLLGK